MTGKTGGIGGAGLTGNMWCAMGVMCDGCDG